MIPRLPSQKTVTVNGSRYDGSKTFDALEQLNEIAKTSNKKTQTEQRVNRTLWSIAHDFPREFNGREHGDDAKTIARQHVEKLLPVIASERVEQQVVQLKAEVEVIRDLLAHKESVLATVDHSRGSGEHHARQAQMAAARAKIDAEAKAAANRVIADSTRLIAEG